MAHTRRKFWNRTKAKQCQRLIPEEGNPLPTQCKERVHKAGLCFEHWKSMRIARSTRPEQTEVVYCNQYKCFKHAVIMLEGTPWCQGHFMRWQKSMMKGKGMGELNGEMSTV